MSLPNRYTIYNFCLLQHRHPCLLCWLGGTHLFRLTRLVFRHSLRCMETAPATSCQHSTFYLFNVVRETVVVWSSSITPKLIRTTTFVVTSSTPSAWTISIAALLTSAFPCLAIAVEAAHPFGTTTATCSIWTIYVAPLISTLNTVVTVFVAGTGAPRTADFCSLYNSNSSTATC